MVDAPIMNLLLIFSLIIQLMQLNYANESMLCGSASSIKMSGFTSTSENKLRIQDIMFCSQYLNTCEENALTKIFPQRILTELNPLEECPWIPSVFT
jgi:hypothetical protein